MSLNLDKQTRLSLELLALIKESDGSTLEVIKAEAGKLANAKGQASGARETANEAGGTLWGAILATAKNVFENAGEVSPESQTAVFGQLMLDALEGNPEAIKSIKPYTSTAKKAIKAANAGTINMHQLETRLVKGTDGNADSEEAVPYKDVRDLLKGSDQKAVDAARRDLSKMIGEVAGRENSTRAAATRLEELQSIIAFVKPLRDKAVAATEASKKASQAAKAASDLTQQQPAAPMTTETVSVPESQAA